MERIFPARTNFYRNYKFYDTVEFVPPRGGGELICHDAENFFDRITSIENLFLSWKEFRIGKASKIDVLEFELSLENNVFDLYYSLKNGTYQHGGYQSFYVCDPKRRHIHKPTVRDRLLHHAVFRIIEPVFNRKFIFDTFSCRDNKGHHAAVTRLQQKAWTLSRNNTMTVWYLKLDIKSFFKSVNNSILLQIISKTIHEQRTLKLIHEILHSFPGGIPLGNLTSQLFANVYMNELDQFIKHRVKIPFYIRYCDDLVLLSRSREELEKVQISIENYLLSHLRLGLHSDKILMGKYHNGIDFLGFVCFPHFKILRTKTLRRMFRKLNKNNFASYQGLVKHACSRHIQKLMQDNLGRQA